MNNLKTKKRMRLCGSLTTEVFDNRELKQTDAAAANLQISIQQDSRPSEFSRPLISIILNLNGNLPVDRRRVSLLKFPNVERMWLIEIQKSSVCNLPKVQTISETTTGLVHQ